MASPLRYIRSFNEWSSGATPRGLTNGNAMNDGGNMSIERLVRSFFVTLLTLSLAVTAHAAVEINSVNPSSGSTMGGYLVTIFGDEFTGFFGSETPEVEVDGAPVSITQFDDNMITFVMPKGQGANLTITVDVDGDIAGLPNAFSYLPPNINTINPASGPLAGGQTVTLTGGNFGLTPVVLVNGAQHAPLMSSHDELSFIIPSSVSPGPASVRVRVLTQISNTVTYTYDAPPPDPPVITSVLNANGPTEGGSLSFIMGQHFGMSPDVTVAGAAATVMFSTDGLILAAIPEGEGAGQSLIVSADGQQSAPFAFNYDPPQMHGFSAIDGSGMLTIFGDDFGLTPTVTIGGVAAPVDSNNHDMIVVTPPAQTPGSMHAVSLQVAGQVSNSLDFMYPNLPADLNGDGTVDGADLAQLLANWGMVN